MLTSHFAFVGAVLCFLTTVGCSVSSEAGSEDVAVGSESALSNSSVFKLYEDPAHRVDTSCDLFTQLNLSTPNSGDGRSPFVERTMVVAHLQEVGEGTCKLRVDADPRSYQLLLDDTACGSHTYKANVTVDGDKRDITITDHRGRTCRDVVPATIIVEESSKSGVRTLYSL